MHKLLVGIIRGLKEPLFLSILTTLFLIVLSGTIFYTSVEGWALTDSIYFAFVSLVPSGIDTGLSPQTDFGKWFTIIYLIAGTGVMLMLLVMIGKSIVNYSDKDQTSKEFAQKDPS
jgi:hypothetical protein